MSRLSPHDATATAPRHALADAPRELLAERPGGVVSLDRTRFERDCARLMAMATHDRWPDALVAIRTGGVFVAEAMARTDPALPILAVTCRRPSSAAKQRSAWILALLGHLPRGVLDRLRLIEHRILTHRQAGPAMMAYQFDKTEVAALERWVDSAGSAPFLLVVDDAVDSGATLRHVLSMLRGRVPAAALVRSAVITVTTDAPMVAVDHALYHGQLCRFPWSRDA